MKIKINYIDKNYPEIFDLYAYYSSITKTSSSYAISDYFKKSIKSFVELNCENDELIGRIYYHYAEFLDHCYNDVINNINSPEYQEWLNTCEKTQETIKDIEKQIKNTYFKKYY